MPLPVTRPERGEFRWSFTLDPSTPRDEHTAAQVQETLDALAAEGPGQAQMWIERAEPADEEFAQQLGFEGYRELWRMQRPLPADRSDLPTRAFVPDSDEQAFLEVNGRAFAWHPEQGHMTLADLRAAQAEPWFDPEGFRLYEREGRLAGFCWTKVHPQETPPGGEIYVIGVDPDFHGQGIGGPLTLAGLDHLADRGLRVGFLYVESDNHPAITVYGRLGFDHHSSNRAYQRTLT